MRSPLQAQQKCPTLGCSHSELFVLTQTNSKSYLEGLDKTKTLHSTILFAKNSRLITYVRQSSQAIFLATVTSNFVFRAGQKEFISIFENYLRGFLSPSHLQLSLTTLYSAGHWSFWNSKWVLIKLSMGNRYNTNFLIFVNDLKENLSINKSKPARMWSNFFCFLLIRRYVGHILLKPHKFLFPKHTLSSGFYNYTPAYRARTWVTIKQENFQFGAMYLKKRNCLPALECQQGQKGGEVWLGVAILS